jgi:putative transposase
MAVTETMAVGPASSKVSERREPPGDAVPADLIEELMVKVRSDGLELLGDGGVIAELTKKLLERALDEELTDHVGYVRGDPAGRGSGNSRNGTTPKRVLTEIGAVDLDVPGTATAPSSRSSCRRGRPVWPGSTRT